MRFFKTLFSGTRNCARQHGKGAAPRKTQLHIEALEERSLMSASPLAWTAPAGSSSNQISVNVIGSRIEILDNGRLVASQNVADTSALTLTTNAQADSTVAILGTPAGVPTTLNLRGDDAVIVGNTLLGQAGTPNDPFLQKTSSVSSQIAAAPLPSLQGASTTPPAVPSGTMADILGNVTINGLGYRHDSVALADAADSTAHHVAVSRASVTGLAPATISYSGIGTLNIAGSHAQSTYAVTSAIGHTYLTVNGTGDAVAVDSSAGWVSVQATTKLFNSATLVGAASGVNSLDGAPGGASLSGAGYFSAVSGFSNIRVVSQSPDDIAVLHTGGGGTTLAADPSNAVMTCGLEHVTAVGFHHLTAYSGNPSTDFATLTGAASGANHLVASADDMVLSQENGYQLSAIGFHNAAAYSESLQDDATLQGSNTPGNILSAEPGHAYLMNTGFRNDVYGFHSVSATSVAGDTAYLFGAENAANHLVAGPANTATLSGEGYSIQANNFSAVYVHDASGADVADFSGGSVYARPTTASFYSDPDHLVQAFGFARVDVHTASQTYALTSAGTLLLQTGLNRPVSSMYVVSGGLTSGWTTVDSGVTAVAVGKLVSPNLVWDQDGGGVRVFGANVSGAAIQIAQTLTDLSDKQIQTLLVREMVRDGALSYATMLDTFNAVESESTVLGAGTLADLQLLVRCAATLGMPADVAGLADNVVNGQKSNADFHHLDAGGHVWVAQLGDVHAGSPTSALRDLVEKWFFGVNEPITQIPYTPVTAPLFNDDTPIYLDVRQGYVGDCWLLADLAAVANQHPDEIESMFTYEGTNPVNGVDIYAVRFFSNGQAHYVTVDSELPGGGTYYDNVVAGGPLWVALLEKAYAEASGAGWVQTHHDDSNSYDVLDGGMPSYALPALTGQAAPEHGVNLSTLASGFQAGQIEVLGTVPSWSLDNFLPLFHPADPDILPSHFYAVVGYVPPGGIFPEAFLLYNPWGDNGYGQAPREYDGHPVYGLFEEDSTYIKDNFSMESITGSLAPAADNTQREAIVSGWNMSVLSPGPLAATGTTLVTEGTARIDVPATPGKPATTATPASLDVAALDMLMASTVPAHKKVTSHDLDQLFASSDFLGGI